MISSRGKIYPVANACAEPPYIECRICLETGTEENKIISPCACKGSVRYVHQSCILSWIRLQLGKLSPAEVPSFLAKQGVECEMCKEEIGFQYVNGPQCRSLDEIKQEIESNCTNFALLIGCFCLMLGILIFAIISYLKISHNSKPFTFSQEIVLLGVIIVISTIIFVIVLFALKHYLIKRVCEITGIINKASASVIINNLETNMGNQQTLNEIQVMRREEENEEMGGTCKKRRSVNTSTDQSLRNVARSHIFE